ncbi:hypothetical protein R5W24_005118 [Gemmata sp. JC717]|uniref:hypothetical protein n=1 Tax=Gemmata algarum TaxID=2975278 RepID=UPI0021BB93DF|nr:hypothetical protein [Gemmata algarum]MDY3555971.1 hypothetical protein [Gemmata algarum]
MQTTCDLMCGLVLELNRRFHARYGQAGGGHVRRATAKLGGGVVAVTLYTNRPYQWSPAAVGGMFRAVVRVRIEGDDLVAVPHSPVLKCLRERKACLTEPGFDTVAWVQSLAAEAERVLVQKLTGT